MTTRHIAITHSHNTLHRVTTTSLQLTQSNKRNCCNNTTNNSQTLDSHRCHDRRRHDHDLALGTPTREHPTPWAPPHKTPPTSRRRGVGVTSSRPHHRGGAYLMTSSYAGGGVTPPLARVPGDSVSRPGTACETASKHLDRSDPQGGHCEHETGPCG